jgi:N-acetylmuramoyl-L-alanine amidase
MFIDLPPQQVQCIAEAIYYEARSESILGQRAVGHVILNRSEMFSKPPCVIIKQPGQFPFKRYKKNWNEWQRVLELAYNLGTDPTRGAMFYHAVYVHPNWKRYKYTLTIGNHKFYALKSPH